MFGGHSYSCYCILQALHQIVASPARSTLEWHLDQHDVGFVCGLSLDHIALPPQPRPHILGTSHVDFQDETSTDEDLEVSTALPTVTAPPDRSGLLLTQPLPLLMSRSM